MDEPLLTLTFPTLPPSVNTHYQFHSRIVKGRVRMRVHLSQEASRWKQQAALLMPPKRLHDDWLYRVEILLVGRWLDKTGLPLVKDCRNHGKLVVDAVFERYRLNDKLVWHDTVLKRHDEGEERVEFRMWRYEEPHQRLREEPE